MAFGKEINITKDAQTNSATTITTNSCSVEFELSGDDTTWLSNVGITSSNRLSFTAAKNDYAHRTAIIKPKVNNNVCTNESKWVKVTQSGGCSCESTISIPQTATTTGITWSWNSTASSSVTATIDSLPCIDGTAPTYGISATSVNGNFNASVTSKTNNSVSILVSPKNNNTAHTVITDEVEVSYNVKDIGACTYPNTIKVMQGRKPCDCSDVTITSSSTLELSKDAQTKTSGFTFTFDNTCIESISAAVTSGDSWITISQPNRASSTSNRYYLTVTVPQNSSYERSGIVTLSVNNSPCNTKQLIVRQANACDCNQLTLTPSSVTLTSGGTRQTITISNISTCITSSAVTTSQTWINAQFNGNSIYVSGDTNNGPSRSGSGTVTYTCDGTNYTKTFNVTQSGGCNCQSVISVPQSVITNGFEWDGDDSSTVEYFDITITNPSCLDGNITVSGSNSTHFSASTSVTASNTVRVSIKPTSSNPSTTTPIVGQIALTYNVNEVGSCTYGSIITLTHDVKSCNCDDFEIIS